MALIFRQLFDPQSATYTYLLACGKSREAILIDPVFEQMRRDSALLQELGLNLIYTLETHIHADHVTGATLLKTRWGSRVAVSAASGAKGADLYLEHGDKVHFGEHYVETRSTPGHTLGCVSYVLGDESMAFCGDCLLIRGSGRTDFQEGNSRALYRSVHLQLFTLPDNCLLYPAHDYRGLTVTSVAEEKRFNPRLGGALSENDFVGFMKGLHLAHPKNRHRRARESEMRQARGEPTDERSRLGAAQLHLCRRLGIAAFMARRQSGLRSRSWMCASRTNSPVPWGAFAAPS